MKSEDRIVIQIAAEYSDNTAGEFQKSAKSADRYCESIKKLKRQMDQISKTKVQTDLQARDSATQVINKVRDNLDYLKQHKRQVTIAAIDKATNVISETKNRVLALSGKTFRFTMGVVDKATQPLQKIWNYATSLKGVLAGLYTGIAGNALVKAPISLADMMSTAQIGFTTKLGDEDAANALMASIEKFAIETPFETKGLIETTNRMIAMGWEAEKVLPDIEKIGNAAAATGRGQEGINRITLALSQMRMKGKVSAEEMLQLSEAGISGWQYLADSMGVSLAEVQKLSERGLIPAEQAIDAIVAGMGEFDGMMEKTSNKTVSGLASQIKDAFDVNVVKRWGQGLQTGAINGLEKFNGWLSDNQETLDKLGNLVEQTAANVSNHVVDMIKGVTGGIEQLINRTDFQNADFLGKAVIAWDQLIAEPFGVWWNGGGKDKVKEGVKNAANGIKDILIDVLGEAFKLAFSNPITGTIATLYGAKYGINIGKGILSGVETAKGLGTGIKNIVGTGKNIIGMLGTGIENTPSHPSMATMRHDPEIKDTAASYRSALDTLIEAKKKFSEEQKTLVEKAHELNDLQASGAGIKEIKTAEKALEKSRTHIKESAANLKNMKDELKTAKEAFSGALDTASSIDISNASKKIKDSVNDVTKSTKNVKTAMGEMSGAAEVGAKNTSLFSKATSGLSAIMAAIPTPVKVAVAAVGLAAAGFAIYTKKQEEHRTALVNAGDDYLEASAKFEEANKNYEEQTANLKNQADAVQRYRDLTNEINTGGLEDDVLNTKLQERDETLLSIKEHYPAAFGEGVSNEEGLQKVEELIKKEQDYQKVLKDRADIELANAQTELIMKLPDMEAEKEKLQKQLENITKDHQIAVDIEAKISKVTQTVNDLEMQISTGVDQEEIEKTKQILSDQLGDTLKSLQEAPGNVQLEFQTALSGIRNDLDKGLEIPQEKIDKLHGAFSGIQSYVNDVKGKFDQTEMQISSIEKSISLGNTVLDEMKQKSGETKGVVDEAKDSASETNKNIQDTDGSMNTLTNNTVARKGPLLDATNAFKKSFGETKTEVEGVNTEIDKLPGIKKITIDVVTKYSTIGVPTPQSAEATKSNASYFEKLFDKEHADGGFMTRPHVGLVAEDGAESIIPLSPKRRSRGIALWQETGRRLGVMAYAEGGIVGQAESYPMAAGGGYATGSGGPSVSGGGGETGRMLSFETGGLKEDLAEADQYFQEYSSNVLTAGLSTWDNLKNNVTSKTQEMNDADKAKFDEFAQYFTTFGTGVVLTGAAAFDALKGGVVTKSTDTVKFGVSKFNEFSNYVGTLPPIFGGYGADMMSELAYGIESQRAAVLKSTSTLVQDLLSTFITGLGIHSPSKKMQWVGEMMAAGIIKGLSADQITQYVYYIIDQMQSSFSSGKLDVGTVVDKLDDNIPALVAKLGVDPKEAASLIYPLLGTAGTLTSVFGGRDAPTAGASTNHGGIDLAAPTGTQIAAVLGGLVTIAGEYGGYGNAVKIDHGNGVESLYGHMSAVGVAPGQQVTAGQVIGNVGSTGISTGPHLHLSMYKGGEAIDPLPYVQGAPIMAGNTLAGALMAEYNRRKFGIGAAGALGGGGDVASWIMQALAITGQSMDYLDELMYIAQMESGGDPNAINLWDSNAAAGHPSKGLMQTIDSTFAAYALPGYDDIWNPVHNAIAAIRYMNERYGGIQNHPGLGGKGYIGYAVGTREVPQDMLAVIHKNEAIFPAAQNPFSKSGGDMIADMVSNVLPFPEMESNSIRNEKDDFAERNNVIEFPERKSDSGQPASVEAVPVVASQNAAPGGMTVSINLGGISISIDGSNAGTPQDIEALLRAQIPGIANDLCAQIAQKLTEILAGMPTRSEAV